MPVELHLCVAATSSLKSTEKRGVLNKISTDAVHKKMQMAGGRLQKYESIVGLLFYPVFTDLQKGIAFWKVPRLRRLSFW
jgi:hypothetical protein